MTKSKTRCSECLYSKNKATLEPCRKCSEIQYPHLKLDNNFIPKEKNLMKEGN